MLTEFGALSNDTGGVDEVHYITKQADRFLQSWSYWQFKLYGDYTTAAKPRKFFPLDFYNINIV